MHAEAHLPTHMYTSDCRSWLPALTCTHLASGHDCCYGHPCTWLQGKAAGTLTYIVGRRLWLLANICNL